MAFSFKAMKVYVLNSVGIEKDAEFPVADILKGIFKIVGRRPSSIKLLEYLILHERMRILYFGRKKVKTVLRKVLILRR